MAMTTDVEALAVLKERFKIVSGGLIEPIDPGYRDYETKEELEAISFLCSEYDYAYM